MSGEWLVIAGDGRLTAHQCEHIAVIVEGGPRVEVQGTGVHAPLDFQFITHPILIDVMNAKATALFRELSDARVLDVAHAVFVDVQAPLRAPGAALGVHARRRPLERDVSSVTQIMPPAVQVQHRELIPQGVAIDVPDGRQVSHQWQPTPHDDRAVAEQGHAGVQ